MLEMIMDDEVRRRALEEAVQRFGEAWAAGDRAAIEALLSPRYTHTDVFGAFHERAAWLAYARERTGRTTRIDFREVRTRIVGDVAIVTGLNEVSGPGARSADDRTALTLRFTQVWIWTDGRWLREAFQATPVAAERAS
jgi:ketosteroid isomerase-like protein